MGAGLQRCILLSLLGISLLASGCVSVPELLGYPVQGTPTVSQARAAQYWALIRNPRFGKVASEPEYIWVEEDKIPTSFRTVLFGKKSVLAPPEILARYGPPPGGGRISPLHGVSSAVSAPDSSRPSQASPRRERVQPAATTSLGEPEVDGWTWGLVVFVDTTRVVIDLTAEDGLQPGSIVSLRRDKIPIVHPVTGEYLGELDEEVATARVVEVREKFSVAEIQGIAPGAQIKLKDRVVPR